MFFLAFLAFPKGKQSKEPDKNKKREVPEKCLNHMKKENKGTFRTQRTDGLEEAQRNASTVHLAESTVPD